MKKKKGRIVSLLIAVVMVLALVPATAFAEAADTDGEEIMPADRTVNTMSVPSDLTFEHKDEYDIPAGKYGTIALIDVSTGVTGGKEPYEFRKVSGPVWLDVSINGRVEGRRPTIDAEATTATIRVTDADNNTADMTISIGEVNSEKTKVDFPTAYTDLVYNGRKQYAVPESSGYDRLTDCRALNAGHYTGEILLKEGFEWSDGSTDNIRKIEFDIAKKTPEVSDFNVGLPTQLEYNGNTKRANIDIKSVYSGYGAVTTKYNGSTDLPNEVGDYVVTVDVEEGDNFNAITDLEVGSFTIEKARPYPSVYVNLKGKKGEKLSTVALPTDEKGIWAWKDGTVIMDTEGEHYFETIFTPYDTAHYMVVDDITLPVTVTEEAGTPTNPEKPEISIPNSYTAYFYDGTEQTVTVNGYDPATMNITGNKGTDAGMYTVSVTSKTGKWADDSTEPVKKQWYMNPALITTLPSFTKTSFEKTGSEINIMDYVQNFDDTKMYVTTASKTKATETGTYLLSIKVINDNYEFFIKEGQHKTYLNFEWKITEPETPVEKIKVSRVNVIVDGYGIGKTVGDTVVLTDTTGVEVCTPKGYWKDLKDGNFVSVPDTDKFKAEKKYYNYVSIKAKDGYVLDDYLTIKYNTSINGDTDCDQIIDGWKNYGYVEGAWKSDADGYYTLMFFMDPIPVESEKNITELPVTLTGFEAGKNVADAEVTTTEPNVTISDVKFIIEDGHDNPEAAGTFKPDIYYRLSFNVMPKEGYKLFLTNAKEKVTINGIPVYYITSLAESTGGAYVSSQLMKLDASAVKYAVNVVNGTAVPTEAEEGTTVTIKATVPDDKKFVKWTSEDGVEFADSTAEETTFTMLGKPVTVKAVLEDKESPKPEKVTVTFDSNGGSDVAKQVIEKGTKAEKPANPKRRGYSFMAWYEDEDFDTKYDFSKPVNDNIILYARWSKNSSGSSGSSTSTKYRVIIDEANNGAAESNKETAAKNTTVTITVKPDDGYEIRKVKVVDSNDNEIKLTDKGNGKYTFTMPASKVYVKASFKEIEKVDVKKDVIKMTIGDILMTLNDKAFYNDVAPVIVNDRTMVPIRVITELFGGTAEWNEATKEVTLTINGKVIKMTVGVVIDKYGTAPVIINDRTFVPVRFVADELGAETSWNDITKTVTISLDRA